MDKLPIVIGTTRYLPDFIKPDEARQRTPQHGTRFEVPSAVQDQLGLWVSGVGYSTANMGHSRNRVLGTYAAVLVRGGRMKFESGPSGRTVLEPGSLVWLFPDIRHDYVGADGPFSEQWLLFGGHTADAFRRHGVLSPTKPHVTFGSHPDIPRLFAQLHEVFFTGGPLSVPLASAILHQLIVTSHGLALGLSGGDGGEEADATIRKAVRMIEEEATTGVTPESLAARLHLGYSTLRRRFKQVTGYAVKEYILRVQLRRGKELLAFTRLPVEKVAAGAGFADPFYFSRLFKEREGVPPSVFRQHETREHG